MNIREKIESGYYTAPPVRWPVLENPVVPYPVAKSWYKQPNSAKVYPVEAKAYQDALRERNEAQELATADAVKRFEIEKATYTARVEAARVRQTELDDEFWRDVMSEIGMASEHPKAERLCAMAMERHGDGREAVLDYAEELAKLLF